MTDIEQLYPRLVVDGADTAIAFYRRAFGGAPVILAPPPSPRARKSLSQQ